MLSRLIITFLCAAAIGSVSGAFLTFDPEQIVFEDIEKPISFSAKLNSKPTEEVTVYFEHPSMSMSKCMIVFNPNNWNAPQEITGVFAPLFVGSSDPPKELPVNSEFLAKAATVGQLSAELSTTDTLKVTQGESAFSRICSVREDGVNTFDDLKSPFNKPGWYYMMFTKDIEIQVFMDECRAGLLCVKKVVAGYGSSVMKMDVSGPVKNLREYSVTEVTQNTNGLQYLAGPEANEHAIYFPYGLVLEIHIVMNDGVVGLDVGMFLGSGYPSPGGLCNIPRPPSPDNKLVGPNGRLYDPKREEEVDDFVDSWSVEDEDVLTNLDAETLNPPIQRPRTVCRIPKDPRPKPTTTTATTTTAITTVDLSESTLSPTITYVLSSTTITTSPSTTSTTSPYLPDHPPTPDRHVRSFSPPSPQPDVVDEIQRYPKPAKI
ncbi:hypothetical protein BASA50_010237 [Batrachochytrium salamandrivorans]|uniref:VWFD domain-containing protein n=1 Tax=Batrachochytrium salamandrivorans TaxID=1357716 RepID=A0ABQ8F260_9FUNG|nr:hypothetical protein BASA60_005527 [Batrachochytrium salamandrivorans]KAH6589138.1 hypothetical protein BASA50_010237 [Batrachochytrium salamandrivorans]KAH6600090.1 hypothetical protein BASA61_002361 [Batrachochytrium salamandrivorans]KAH9271042.1 hypothetical protein BASA83_006795 [Batrachochytrium salamandrivorans]